FGATSIGPPTGTKARTRVSNGPSSLIELKKQLEARTRELAEAREQQRATSEVLQVISSSPTELEPVFQAMLPNAVHVCEAKFGSLFLCDGDLLRRVAGYNMPPELVTALRKLNPRIYRVDQATTMARAVRTKQIVHIPDIRKQSLLDESLRAVLVKYGVRTVLAVPLLQEKAVLGVIAIHRREVRPFSDKQIQLVRNFAAQAVIAIENTRLLNELRQRTGDLSEALEQQTATSEVLQVISSSPGELEPVFEAMLANAVRICEARFGNLYLHEGGALRVVPSHNVPRAFAEARRRGPFRPAPVSALGKLIRTKQTVHHADTAATQPYAERDPAVVDAVELGGVRTLVVVPMLKNNDLVGPIAIFPQQLRPCTDTQIELVSNFAKQAVIAIENTRLLNELRESLQQQTATSEVLQVISSSPGALEPVFRAMLENATRICEADLGTMALYENGAFRHVAHHGAPAAYADLRH